MLNKCFAGIENRVLAFQKVRQWKLYLVIFCCLYCILSNTPGYTMLLRCRGLYDPTWETINKQADHPLTPITVTDPELHDAKLAFRIVPPLLARILPSHDLCDRMLWLFCLQNLAGACFIFLLIRLTEKHISDGFLRLLIPCCFCVLYTVNTFFSDLTFFFDSFAFLFLLISVYYSRFFIVLISLLLAFFTDERAVVASGFVGLYHLLYPAENKKSTINPAVIAPLVAIGFYLSARCWLGYQFGLHTPHGKGTGVGPVEVLSNSEWGYISLGIFSAFKSFWIILLAGIFYMRNRTFAALYLAMLFCIAGMGISAFDFSRSVSYGFIGILIAFFEMNRQESGQPGFKPLLMILFVTSLVNPILGVKGNECDISRPVFVKLLNRLHTDKSPDR